MPLLLYFSNFAHLSPVLLAQSPSQPIFLCQVGGRETTSFRLNRLRIIKWNFHTLPPGADIVRQLTRVPIFNILLRDTGQYGGSAAGIEILGPHPPTPPPHPATHRKIKPPANHLLHSYYATASRKHIHIKRGSLSCL